VAFLASAKSTDDDCVLDGRRSDKKSGRLFDSISIFSSCSSNRSFNSWTSVSNARTRSSRDSVYPRGKARRLSLSDVLHTNPTLAHCEQHGVMPSHRIFLLRHLSQAWAILLCALVPSLITFIGRMPGMIAICSLVEGFYRDIQLDQGSHRCSRVVLKSVLVGTRLLNR